MKKYGAPLALLLFVFQMHAMEVEIEPCYLSIMPTDVLNLIAHFLTCDDETEEQFIARTLDEKLEKDEYYYKNAHHEVCMPNLRLHSHRNGRGISLCSNGKRLALGDHDKLYVYKGLEKSDYECCDLSLNGGMIAIFHRQFLPGEQYKTAILELLQVKTEDIPDQENGNLIIEKRRELARGDRRIQFVEIAFNKQGNQLIAWNLSSSSKADNINKNDYTIFSLKKIDPDKPQMLMKITNKLQEYFKDKCVCKYIEGKK
jgi:hypothetical protein